MCEEKEVTSFSETSGGGTSCVGRSAKGERNSVCKFRGSENEVKVSYKVLLLLNKKIAMEDLCRVFLDTYRFKAYPSPALHLV